MKNPNRSTPEPAGQLVPPPRKPPTAIGTGTLPDSPNVPPYRPGTYPDGPNRIQRAALGILGSTCMLAGGALVAAGLAGAVEFGVAFLAAGAGLTWRAVHVQRRHRARRSPQARSRAA